MNHTLSINDMQALLAKAAKHAPPLVEKNIFEIENVVGRYEDVTSDVLRFLLVPNESHQLGAVFLSAFFNCMKARRSEINLPPDLTAANASTRVRTEDGKYPDFVVSGRNWVLIIENKIDADLYNPFGSYEQFAKQHFPNAQHFFVVLSPDGKVKENWIPVAYQEYCRELKRCLATLDQTTIQRKWLYFAQDFVCHLETKMYPTMRKLEPNERAFIEDNLATVAVLKQQAECYMQELKEELAAKLKEIMPSCAFNFEDMPDHALQSEVVEFENLKFQFFFKTPAHDLKSPKPQFHFSLWVKGATSDQESKDVDLFETKEFEEGGCWIGSQTATTKSEALIGLCRLAERLMDVIK